MCKKVALITGGKRNWVGDGTAAGKLGITVLVGARSGQGRGCGGGVEEGWRRCACGEADVDNSADYEAVRS